MAPKLRKRGQTDSRRNFSLLWLHRAKKRLKVWIVKDEPFYTQPFVSVGTASGSPVDAMIHVLSPLV